MLFLVFEKNKRARRGRTEYLIKIILQTILVSMSNSEWTETFVSAFPNSLILVFGVLFIVKRKWKKDGLAYFTFLGTRLDRIEQHFKIKLEIWVQMEH